VNGTKVEVPETVRIRRFAYEKWVYFFEKFYVDGEEEIVMRRSGFIFFSLQFPTIFQSVK
jgi:hypothetical protein